LRRVIIADSSLKFFLALKKSYDALSKMLLNLGDMGGVPAAKHQNIPAFRKGVAQVVHQLADAGLYRNLLAEI
jgi:hypothetical protein